ncbi:hypothetical protein NX722_21345 [Endozoicomonas gorgoniicola]|uniref:Uncharacterized protein n=1 Tax=Endozoicomonas gorgoniicola TaxID=1234144 RepID=A0ABT3N0H2_9GAMM|nr:hypothetical protein [Endozoicomonas gorgoniicola]MCW7555122.1 hypothetical protein [Endozoicomonas gorgoniicola]
MKYCHISFAACFMSLSSLAFSGIYPALPDVGVSAQVRECSDFFSGACLSIKKQISLRVVYPQLFNEAESNRFLVSAPDNNLHLIVQEDNTDQYSLHFIDRPKSQSVFQEKLSPYFRNLKRIARSNVRIKYTPVNNALTFIHPEGSVAITVDGFYSDLNKKAVIATMLSEKAIAVMNIVAEAISSDAAVNPDTVLSTNKNSDRVPESDKGDFLEAYEGHYVFHPYSELFYSSPDHGLSLERVTIENAKFENKAYEYSLGDAYKLSFLDFGQAVIKPIGDVHNEGEPTDGKDYQYRNKETLKKTKKRGASGDSTSKQQREKGSGARGASSGGDGDGPPRKNKPKKHIPDDYNAPEKTLEEIDSDIESLIKEIKETNQRLALLSSRKGVATGSSASAMDNPASLKAQIKDLNQQLQLARTHKRELESKAMATSRAPKGNESKASTSRNERRPALGRRKSLDDDYDNPYDD